MIIRDLFHHVNVLRYIRIVSIARFAFLVLGLGLTACNKPDSGKTKQRPVPAVIVAPVERQKIADEVEAIGTLKANETVVISATVTATISEIYFDDGQQVERGDVLLSLASDEQRAELKEAKANYDDALRRLERLRTIGNPLASESEIDEALAERDANLGRVQIIEARLADRMVLAPFSGVLGTRLVSVGALVTPGTDIARLDDVSVLKLDFNVPEAFLGNVRTGNKVIAQSPARSGQDFEGSVSFVDGQVNASTRSVLARATIPNANGELVPGMLMNVSVFSEQYESLLIDEGAIIQSGERVSVFVLKNDNVVEQRSIQIAKRVPGKVAVASGLKAQENVVIEGTLTLRDGMNVRVLRESTSTRTSEKKSPSKANTTGT